MARPLKDPKMNGVYARGNIYWMRWNEGGKQRFASLGETDLPRAIQLAGERLKTIELKPKLSSWNIELEKYLSEKLRDGDFSHSSAQNSRYACLRFTRWAEETGRSVLNPSDAPPYLEPFYKSFDQGHQQTAQSYIRKIRCFLTALGISTKPIKFRGELQYRHETVSYAVMETMLGECEDKELAFVLHCGFLAGMRRNEIVMMRRKYIDQGSNNPCIHLPSSDQETGFRTKSGRSRTVPIMPEFQNFLNSWKEWQERDFIIAPGNIGKKAGKKYRYDIRKPFENFLAKGGGRYTGSKGGKITMHMMRHTFITNLFVAGKPLAVICEVSGDRIQTLEMHYMHAKTTALDLEDGMFSHTTPSHRKS
jgi:integrase